MISELNKNIVNDTFNNVYSEEQFTKFIKDLLPSANYSEEKVGYFQIPNDYKDFIRSTKRICKYKYTSEEYVDDKIIDVLVVKLKRTSSIERARVAQRNYIARYLDKGRGDLRDAALVAFISEDENGNIAPDWRFSFVQMNWESKIVDGKNGKKRITEKQLTPAKRFSFLVGENEDTHTAQKQFATCLEKSSKGKKITIEDLVQAFDIEKVSKEFFDKYKTLYLKLRDELIRLCKEDKIINKDFVEHNINVDDFAKKTLGQLVFLYFIQKKGWLGVEKDKDWGTGDKKFLRNVFDGKYGEYDNFFNDILEYLFYEALATDRGQAAWFDKLNCRIPFLNGGLFEPANGYEWTKTDLTIDNSIFKEIFDTFDLYNFTVKEDEPLEKEVAIDPEMLGKVFEKLIEENERKGNGAFYTPREIVHYMCQESLINYLYNKINIKEVPLTEEEKNQQLSLLKTKKEKEQLKLTHEVIKEIIPKEDIEFLIKTGSSTYINKQRGINIVLPESVRQNACLLDNALADIKVCDPAIGSGAFPVGMMNEIVRARATLSEFIQPDRLIYQLKRNAIENSIYGVDIDPGAVDIAKLRFWLSLVVDEEDIKKIKPLPNLDYKIMQGNSLITSYEGIDFDEIVSEQPKHTQLDIFSAGSLSITDQISKKQNEFLKTPYPTRKSEIKQKIEDLIVELVKAKFEEKAIKECKDKDFYEERIRNFAQNKEKRNFFPWKLFFADVFEEGGFDIVVGNPPYVDSEEMVKSMPVERKIYSDKFSSAKGNWDLFIVFCELSLLLGKNNSINSFIVPNKILAAKYSEEIRKIFKNKSIITIRDYSRIDVFKEADVYPIVYVLSNNEHKKQNVIMAKMNEGFEIETQNIIKKEIFYNDILWDKYFQNDNSVKVLIKISENNKLSKYNNFSITAAATVNEAYQIKEVLQDCANFDSFIYFKFVNSGIIDKYKILWGNKYTLYIKDKYKNPVVSRDCIGKINNARLKQALSPKIIIANMTKEIEAYYDEGKCLAAKSTIIICGKDSELKYLTGLLNSKLISWWYKINYNSLKMSGEALGFGSNEIASIPICTLNNEQINKINLIVDKILQLNLSDDVELNTKKQQTIKEYENQVDIIVYKLYNLTYQEVLTIDPTFPSIMSEEEYNNNMI